MYLTPYRLPNLEVPFNSKANPHSSAAERHAMDWVRYFDLLKTSAAFKKFEGARFPYLAAHAYPDASEEDLFLITDWLCWLFVQDDHFDEARIGRHTRRMQSYVETALTLLRQPRLVTVREDGALLAGLGELWQRFRARMDTDLAARFVMAFEAYTTGCLWELENRAYGYSPTENEYIIIRRDTSGFRPCALLIEMALGDSLPPLAREHPVIRRMQDITNDVLSWTNDLFSLEKEAKRKDMHNLVLVLRGNQMSVQEAVDAVGARIDQSIAQFIEMESALPTFNRETDKLVADYVGGLKSWMAANLDWSIATGRYERALDQSEQTGQSANSAAS